jgi:hypothetical protein
MRTLVFQKLTTDATLAGLGITAASTFAGDTDTVTQRPYIALRWGTTAPGVDVSRQRGLTVWVHDHYGDYTRIDAIIKRIRDIMLGLGPVQTEIGWITDVDWITDSDDLSDDVSHTILRTTTFNIVGSGF